MNKNLPLGWSWVKLGDVCEITMGQSPPSSTYNTHGNGLPFFQGKAEFTELHPVTEKWCSIPKKIANKNDILISVRAPVGNSNIADQECCIGRGLAAIRYPECNKYVFYYLRSIVRQLDELGTGTTFQAISGKILKEFPFPFPPILVQNKIVDKLEELFSELDKGVENLRKAKEQMKTYRQSVLTAAFSGRLMGDLRRKMENGKLPEGWKWMKLGEVIKSIQYGTSDKATADEDGIPVLRMGNIQDGILDFTNLKYFPKDYVEKDKYLLENDDILFNRTNSAELVGKSALYKRGHTKAIFASYLIRLKTNEEIYSATLLNYYINSSYGKDYIKSVVSQNVGQANVNGTKLKNMPVLLIPIQQQYIIVSEIERRFSVADKLEQTIDESLSKAEQIRQSILKKAFNGELV